MTPSSTTMERAIGASCCARRQSSTATLTACTTAGSDPSEPDIQPARTKRFLNAFIHLTSDDRAAAAT